MDIGFDGRTLVVNHVVFALWTAFMVPASDPLSILDGASLAVGVVLALWAVSAVALLVIDGIVAYRLLRGA